MTQIESKQNATLRHFARLQRDKKYRRQTGEMLCEGDKLLWEALESGAEVRTVLMQEQGLDSLARGLCARAELAGARLAQAPDTLFRLACDAVTPQGIVFSCKAPTHDPAQLTKVQHALLLDGLQDPGNLGTILRTADAFAVDVVILGEGCADFTAPKVVRATMGAIFRQPILCLPLEAAVQTLHAAGIPVFAAALQENAVPVHTVSLSPGAVIIGSEGHGVSEQTLALADRAVILPMAGRAESLNAGVAASILMWEMMKGR